MEDEKENRQEKTFPFKEPFFRPSGKKQVSGFFVTFPIAYQESIRVFAEFKNGPALEDFQAWNVTYHCKRD